MPIRVMLVDDSAIVRGLMQRALKAEPAIEVVATAMDGQMALDVLRRTPTDIVILDVEMPVMDGLTALPEILRISPKTKIIMASTLTLRNAEIALRAMALGASDYIAKPSARDGNEVEAFYRDLILKVKAFAPPNAEQQPSTTPQVIRAVTRPQPVLAPGSPIARPQPNPPHPDAIAIASSTGGPQALLQIFSQFKGKPLRVPVFITQHMPPNFTTILSDHLSKAFGGDCHEAKDGERVQPGVVYVAPGDYHMVAEREATGVTLRLNQNAQENFCRPAADPMLRSLAKAYRAQLLVAVLTGIGSDGTKGAADVVAAGGTVISQDEASSVVYGMPRAVAEAQLSSAVLPLSQIGSYLARAVQ